MSIWVESFLTEMGSGQWCIRIDTDVSFCYGTLEDVIVVNVDASQSYFFDAAINFPFDNIASGISLLCLLRYIMCHLGADLVTTLELFMQK